MLPEEVKVLILTEKPLKLPYDIPFQVFQNQSNGKFDYYFPASRTVSKKIQPMVAELHQIKELLFEKIAWAENRRNLFFTLTAPYRMNDLRLCIRLTEKTERNTTLKIYESRYYGEQQSSSYASCGRAASGENRIRGNIQSGDLIPKAERYFTAPIPAGGQTAFHLAFDASIAPEQLEVWAVGFETCSVECAERNGARWISPKPCAPASLRLPMRDSVRMKPGGRSPQNETSITLFSLFQLALSAPPALEFDPVQNDFLWYGSKVRTACAA